MTTNNKCSDEYFNAILNIIECDITPAEATDLILKRLRKSLPTNKVKDYIMFLCNNLIGHLTRQEIEAVVHNTRQPFFVKKEKQKEDPLNNNLLELHDWVEHYKFGVGYVVNENYSHGQVAVRYPVLNCEVYSNPDKLSRLNVDCKKFNNAFTYQ